VHACQLGTELHHWLELVHDVAVLTLQDTQQDEMHQQMCISTCESVQYEEQQDRQTAGQEASAHVNQCNMAPSCTTGWNSYMTRSRTSRQQGKKHQHI
jgi:hypothetical protein